LQVVVVVAAADLVVVAVELAALEQQLGFLYLLEHQLQ
jgi:hypothetical protein